MTGFRDRLSNRDLLIGMVHLRALPGTPRNTRSIAEIERIALHEAMTLVDAGFDALLIENMHDLPYLNREVGPEIVAAMTEPLLGQRTLGGPIQVAIA